MFRIRRHGFRAVALCACAVVGIVLGVVLYRLPTAYWWQNNRWNFACKLLYDGFGSVLFALLLPSVLVCFAAVVASLRSYLSAICYVTALLVGIYTAAIVCAIATMSVVSCVLYTLLFLSVELVGHLLLHIFVACDDPCDRTFAEAVCGLKILLIAYLVLFIAKILLIFVVLRPIIGLI